MTIVYNMNRINKHPFDWCKSEFGRRTGLVCFDIWVRRNILIDLAFIEYFSSSSSSFSTFLLFIIITSSSMHAVACICWSSVQCVAFVFSSKKGKNTRWGSLQSSVLVSQDLLTTVIFTFVSIVSMFSSKNRMKS